MKSTLWAVNYLNVHWPKGTFSRYSIGLKLYTIFFYYLELIYSKSDFIFYSMSSHCITVYGEC